MMLLFRCAGTASALFFLLGSMINLGLAIGTWQQEMGEQQQRADDGDNNNDDDDDFFYTRPYRILSCLAASCYLLDVALDQDHERRSTLVATLFGVGAALELLSTIVYSDWIMVMAVHFYLAAAGWILAKPPHNVLEGAGDIMFGLGCGFDVLLSYCYWNESLAQVVIWGDVFSATLWFLNACVVVWLTTLHAATVVVVVPYKECSTSLEERPVEENNGQIGVERTELSRLIDP
jgi:hypothetical protein